MKLGIVGTGVGIRTHLPSALNNSEIDVVGVVGRSIDRCQELLSSEGYAATLACSWSDLLAKNPDIICITTSLGNRSEYLQTIGNFSGVLLIEKPLVGDNLAPPFDGFKNRAFVDFQLRGLATIAELRSRICNGNFGSVYSIALFERTSGLLRDNLADWMYNTNTGGGQRFGMGSHLVDLGVFVSGNNYKDVDLEGVRGRTAAPCAVWKKNAPTNADTDEVFECDFTAAGCHISVSTTSISHGPRTLDFRVEGTEGAAEFQYRDGFGELREWTSAGESVSFVGPDGVNLQAPPNNQLNSSAFRVGYPNYLDSLVGVVQGEGRGVLATFEDGLLNAAILERTTRMQ